MQESRRSNVKSKYKYALRRGRRRRGAITRSTMREEDEGGGWEEKGWKAERRKEVGEGEKKEN